MNGDGRKGLSECLRLVHTGMMNVQPSNHEAISLIVSSRTVLAIALPMTFAFLTVPLIGIVDTAVVGQFGDAALIGGLAIGAVIFDLVFTAFNFLRTGTTGFVAQAYGRGDKRAQQAYFWRAFLLAVGIGIAMVVLSPLIRMVGLWLMSPGIAVAEAADSYMAIRFLATPFTLINYAILGYLLGRDSVAANVVIQTLVNGLNIVLSLVLGLWLGWGLVGVALGTLIAEAAIALTAFVWIRRGFDPAFAPTWSEIIDRDRMTNLLAVNRDIMIRSFALITAFFMFTRFGAGFGEDTLAANAILMNFFLVSAYFLDGLASASEQMVGRALGANRRDLLWAVIRYTCGYGFILSAIAASVVWFAGPAIVDAMTTAQSVVDRAIPFIGWAALTPLLGVLAFQMDGVYIGATWSVTMRNMMLVSLAAFLVLGWWLSGALGNHGLWLALNVWLALRGVTLLGALPGRIRENFG